MISLNDFTTAKHLSEAILSCLRMELLYTVTLKIVSISLMISPQPSNCLSQYSLILKCNSCIYTYITIEPKELFLFVNFKI